MNPSSAGTIPSTLLLAGSLVMPAAEPVRPHIIVILADDMGLGDLGCYGGAIAPTPNIDRLAAEGTRFTRFYTGAPVCSPARASLITGRFPASVGLHTYLDSRAKNREREQVDALDPRHPSIARILKSGGYATGHFGKWHLGGGRDVRDAPPFSAYGFDAHASTYESPAPHPDLTATDWIWSDQDAVKRWDRTGFFVDRTLEFLRRNQDKPCYVNLWPDDVHTPWVPGGDDPALRRKGKEDRPRLAAVLVAFDRQVGRLMAGLKAQGLDDRTLVILTSDNGPLPTFQHARTMGLRGSKISLYEGGIRMPGIVRWPGHVPAGRTDERTVFGFVDLLPTLCAVAGVPVPAAAAGDGEDLSRALRGETVARCRPLCWEYGWNERFPAREGQDLSPRLAILDGDRKLLMDHQGGGLELYDLATDAQEMRNLATERAEEAQRLRERLLTWRRSLPALVR